MIIHLGPPLPVGSSIQPESIGRTSHSLCGLAPSEVCLAIDVAIDPVGSYPAVAPLPDPLAGPSAVCFLLHCLSGHPAWPLASTLSYGARIFLPSSFEDRRSSHTLRTGTENRTLLTRVLEARRLPSAPRRIEPEDSQRAGRESNPFDAGFGGPPLTISTDPLLLLSDARPGSALTVLQVEQPTRSKTSRRYPWQSSYVMMP